MLPKMPPHESKERRIAISHLWPSLRHRRRGGTEQNAVFGCRGHSWWASCKTGANNTNRGSDALCLNNFLYELREPIVRWKSGHHDTSSLSRSICFFKVLRHV